MRVKEILSIILIVIAFCMMFFFKNFWIFIIGICIIYLYSINDFLKKVLRWNKNKNKNKNKNNIKIQYVKAKSESYILEIAILLNIYLEIKDKYEFRAFDLEYNHNKIVEINNFKDFLGTYDGKGKVMIYMIIVAAIGVIISIVQKKICRTRISSEQILFSDGEIIKLEDIEDINIKESEWTYSKKIKIKSQEKERFLNLSKKSFLKVEKYLTKPSMPIASS